MSCCNKLSVWRFGFALGLIWALGMLVVGWAGWQWQYGIPFVKLWSSVYVGFKPTLVGGLIGAAWGFVDFFVFGVLIAWVYNLCGKNCSHGS
ncbi:MAG: bacteriophage holin [Gammaproteobacteria bacterium]|nr:bacteriophage holin [Gammaproteobacteria bacterium]